MDLDLSEQERAVVATFSRLLERESSRERVRAAETTGFDARLWSALMEFGVLELASEAAGEDGGGFVGIVLLAEVAGRRLACAPLIETVVARRLLERVATADDAVAAVVRSLPGDAAVAFAPTAAQDGVAVMVPGGAVAASVLALDGDELVLITGEPAKPLPDIGFLAAGDRALRGAAVTRHVLAAGAVAEQRWLEARAEWRLAAAAVCAGLALEVIDIGTRYAAQRHQFGVAIGSFQAVQERLATVVGAADGAQLLVRETAWRRDTGFASWQSLATVAYAHASETAVLAAEAALHVHGGYGYTLEYDPQLYLRRAQGLLLAGGDPADIWVEVGSAAVEED